MQRPIVPVDPDVLLDQKQVARLLNMSPKFLEGRRVRGGGPKFILCGRYIRYRREDVKDWLASRERTSTSAPRPAA